MRKPLFIVHMLILVALLAAACTPPAPAPAATSTPASGAQPVATDKPADPKPADTQAPNAPTAEATTAVTPEQQSDVPPPYQYNATTLPAKFNESPMLADKVAAGSLPPVEERLPKNPPVVVPYEQIGKYGGNARSNVLELSHFWLFARQMGHTDLVRQSGGNSGVYEPDLAESWEPSADFRSWTFHLREGIKWSDGEPFTTADIMFWYEHVLGNDDLQPAKPAWLRSGDGLVKIEAPDALTLVMTYENPRPLLLLDLTTGNSHDWNKWMNHPAHYMQQFHPGFVEEADLKKKVDEVGLGSWVDLYRRETEPHTARAGRPYLWAWTPDGPISPDGRWNWTRNAYYYKIDEQGNQLPYIDTWITQTVGDNQAILLNTIAGEFDMVHTYIRGDMLPTVRDAIDKGAPMRIIENLNAKTGEVSLYINQTVDEPVLREIFNDVRFRQAVSLGIDRTEVSEARFRGFSTPGQASFPPNDPFVYNDEWFNAYVEYDPDAANALLDEMGLDKRDSAGFRLRPDGKRLTIIMDYQSGNHTAAIELLPDHLKNIGIELQVVPAAPALFSERTLSNSVQWAGWSFQPSFYGPMNLIPGPNRPFGVEWVRWYQSRGAQGEEPPADMKRVMELMDLIPSAQTIEERAELIREAGRLHQENLWVIGLAGMDLRPHIVNKDMLNVPPAPYGLNIDPAGHSMYTETWFFNR